MSKRDWTHLRVAVTGMNNTPDNPGPGYSVARCIRNHESFRGEIVGLGYDVLDGGLYHDEVCDAGFLMPLPAAGEMQLLRRIEEIHRRCPIDVLIPCLDSELLAFCRIRSHLETMGIKMLLPSEMQIRARNKDRLMDLCAPLPVTTPETKAISSVQFFNRCEDEGWRFPMVIKGVFYDAKIVYDVYQARVAFESIARSWGYPVMVQKYLKGDEVNLTAVGDGQGNMLGAVMMRKRAMTEKGKAWAGVAIRDMRLEALASCLIRALQWEGPLEVEVLRTPDGNSHLLEINPRFPAWIYLSHGVGCNLPVALLKMITGYSVDNLRPTKTGSLFIRYAEELIVDLPELESMTMKGERFQIDPSRIPDRREKVITLYP